jgi:hypothetical protein
VLSLAGIRVAPRQPACRPRNDRICRDEGVVSYRCADCSG